MTAVQKRSVKTLEGYVNAYLVAHTHAELWRQRMTDWERQELARFEYLADKKWVDRGRAERITDPKYTFMLAQPEAWNMFFEERQYYVDSLKVPGLKHGNCPACMAEGWQRTTETLLIQQAAMLPGLQLTDVTPEKLLRHGLQTYRKMIDLLVGLVVNSPGYKAPELAGAQ